MTASPDRLLDDLLVAVHVAQERQRNGTLGPTGVGSLLMDIERGLRGLRLAATGDSEGPGLDAILGSLDEDDLMYDHPVSMTGEPMDPVLFVRWDALAARLTSGDEMPDGLVRCPLCGDPERVEDIVGGVCLTCADGIAFSQNARRGAVIVSGAEAAKLDE